MGTEAHIRVSGAWKKANKIHVRVSGIWKRVNKAHVRVGGVWKKFHNPTTATILTIPSGTTVTNYNIKTALGNPSGAVNVILNVSGNIYGTGTSPALDTGSLAVGSTVTINVLSGGQIIGYGGRGSNGRSQNGSIATAATAGGDAINLQCAATISNAGVIAGGGGGGGGGTNSRDAYYPGTGSYGGTHPGSGGGGGRGNASQPTSGAGLAGTHDGWFNNANNGSTGNSAAPGNGGALPPSGHISHSAGSSGFTGAGQGGAGGNGGAWGTGGANGGNAIQSATTFYNEENDTYYSYTNGSYSNPAPFGAGGYAVKRNGHSLSWSPQGTTYGNIT